MTSGQLDKRAVHVAFEVTMLVDQLEFYVDNHRTPWFPASSSPQPEEQAVLEASLVHLRLLDEFLGPRRGRSYPDDVRASDWPGWSPRGFLSDASRRRINAHVAHLSSRRVIGQEWNLARLGNDCCVRMLEFFTSLPAERLPAFAAAPQAAEQGRQRFAAELAAWTKARRTPQFSR